VSERKRERERENANAYADGFSPLSPFIPGSRPPVQDIGLLP
jgi:hypothetical protein